MSDHVFRLHHVALVVQNLKSSVDWYCDFLDFKHQYDFALPGAQVSMIVRGDARLELYQVDGAVPVAPERLEVKTILKVGGINHMAFVVDDLDAAVADMAAKGVEIAIPPSDVPNDSGDRFAFIRDNERTLVELLQPAH